MVHGVEPLREPIYFDVRVFHLHAPFNNACYRKHDLENKCVNEQRIMEIEHSTFTPVRGGSGRVFNLHAPFNNACYSIGVGSNLKVERLY